MFILLWAAAGAAYHFKLLPMAEILILLAVLQLATVFLMLSYFGKMRAVMNWFCGLIAITHAALPFLNRFMQLPTWLLAGADWIAGIAAIIVILYTIGLAWANNLSWLYGVPPRT